MGCINTKHKIILRSIEVSEVKSPKSKKDIFSDSEDQKKLNDIKEPKYQYISSCEISEVSDIQKEASAVQNWSNVGKFRGNHSLNLLYIFILLYVILLYYIYLNSNSN